jgi:hypothetical protein
MDRLWVVKSEIEPFKGVIPGIGGAMGILPIFRCTLYKCPYCKWPFKIAWSSSNSLLGDGARSCWHCKQVFWDGSNEWPEMSSKERELFVLPISIAGWLAGTLVMFALTLYLSHGRADVIRGLVINSPLMIPLLMWFGFRLWQIIRSVRRYDQRGSVKAR